MTNIILNTDSYKVSHYVQYPKDTEYLSCYIESRGGDFKSSMFFGLQMFLQEYCQEPITQKDIDEAEEVLSLHGLNFNKAGWEYILKEHSGYLPISIEAVKEGSVIPNRNALLQITNTDPQCFWLPTYLETSLLRAIWYPSTVATISHECKKIIKEYLIKTSDNLERMPYMLADFGARGVSSFESAGIGGLAHLISFFSTSTISSLIFGKRYYDINISDYATIPASEHSTIISWGKDSELQAYENMVNEFSKEGSIYAVVSDSYDIYHAVSKIWGDALREKVIATKGLLIIRSDSGEPVDVVLKIIEILMQKFGYTVNSKGYKLLHESLRVLHGDRVSISVISNILQAMEKKSISADNISFGMGAGLLQKINRDTQRFAMKLSAIKRKNMEWQNVCKKPITAQSKASKAGRLALIKEDEVYKTIKVEDLKNHENHLIKVFENGKFLRKFAFKDIKKEADYFLNNAR